jgi:hypothetical protein
MRTIAETTLHAVAMGVDLAECINQELAVLNIPHASALMSVRIALRMGDGKLGPKLSFIVDLVGSKVPRGRNDGEPIEIGVITMDGDSNRFHIMGEILIGGKRHGVRIRWKNNKGTFMIHPPASD